MRSIMWAALFLASCGSGSGPGSGEDLAQAVLKAIQANDYEQFSALVCWDQLGESEKRMTRVLFDTGLREVKFDRASLMPANSFDKPDRLNLPLAGYIRLQKQGESSYTVLPYGQIQGKFYLAIRPEK